MSPIVMPVKTKSTPPISKPMAGTNHNGVILSLGSTADHAPLESNWP